MDDDDHTIFHFENFEKLAQFMGKLRASNQLQDVLIVCKDGTTLHGNSTILATCCVFFQLVVKMQSKASSFTGQYSSKLPVRSELLRPLLDLLHTGTARVAKRDREQFLELAKLMQVNLVLCDAPKTPSSLQKEK